MTTRLQSGDALLIVDVQNDFLPGGQLAVTDGDTVIAPLNRWIERFQAAGLPIFATRDWHPAAHCSFIAQGGPWPNHCVANTDGARFATALRLPKNAKVISKATTVEVDAYSGFGGTDLSDLLQHTGSQRLFIGGLATDYCVLNTVLDACRLGYNVVLLSEAIRAVNVQAGDGARAIAEMQAAGATLLEESPE
ncbi:nicotinamidase [Propionivibrio dicarboxylicus]|uniref:nicotinamidase n=1 Tax=Propionivibrio dicarboxylicus TaxID=83767 RepID=A0A1G8CRD1_9RHOO|nr:nicotinamidase [Propionivibrio dicarboxylicus]SDH47470.1 nicotinamidase/pyrazinamidase [Propionivibrio dicarboxylicus]